MKNKNIPEVRINIFCSKWEKYKLGNLGSFKNGMNFDKGAMGHGYPFVNLQNVFGKTIVEDEFLGLAESTDKERKDYNLLKGDVLFIRSSVKPEGVGEAALITKNLKNTTFSGFIIRFRPNNSINDDFKRIIFKTKSFRTQIMARSTSSANTNINQASLEKITVNLPSVEEQMKIGLFFKNLDDTIAIHQQELEALKLTKKGFLQKMFPKGGENVPQIRFNEFTKPWTQIEFGKIIKLVGGATPLKENKEYWNGDIVWLSSQEIKNKYVSKGTYLITEQAVRDNRTKVVSEGTPLIVTRSGILAKRFPISISLNEVAINQDIKALIFDRERFDTEFLVAEIKSKESYILKNIVKTGTTVQSVNLPDLNRMNLYIPEYAEQLKIGEFFRQLDEVIELKEKELDALKETKKGFLQKMFV